MANNTIWNNPCTPCTCDVGTVQHPDSRKLDPGYIPEDLPRYAMKYPTLEKVKLAAVKNSIYHPCLPSIRRSDMDDAVWKLPEEHCRHSTSLQPEDFLAVDHPMPWKDIASLENPATQKLLEEYKPDIDDLDSRWRRYIDMSPEERAQLKNPLDYKARDLHLNQCLRVIPNQLREPPRMKEPCPLEQHHVAKFVDRYRTNYRMFSAAARPCWK